jgi:hypothetical protein
MSHCRLLRAYVLIPLLFLPLFSDAVNAGWFGYDSYAECYRAERQKRMDRWISPMNAEDASIAAKSECHEYRTPYYIDPEQARQQFEKARRERLAREEKMRNFRNYGDTLPFTPIFVVSGHSFAKRADLACLDVALGQVAFQARQAFDRPSVDVRWFGPW